jgi:hypothetical protein
VSQRDSGYVRKERDCYETPEWVTEALIPHIPKRVKRIWEPACGSGKMMRALQAGGFKVDGTDIVLGTDFLGYTRAPAFLLCDAIITNPPYELATEFIDHALELASGVVAMLLRTDFDHARSRRHLFGECSAFSKKLVLTRRIKWFEDSRGQPSFNHAWFIWDWEHKGPPTLAYH